MPILTNHLQRFPKFAVGLAVAFGLIGCGGGKKTTSEGEPDPEASTVVSHQQPGEDETVGGSSNGGGSVVPSTPAVSDTTPPAVPTITSPALGIALSKLSSLTIDGGCEADSTVVLSGDASASQSCAGGAFSFSVSKTSDGFYTFSVVAQDQVPNASSPVTVTWTRDTTAPAAPILVSPISPYTSGNTNLVISGSCEVGSTVNLAGASSGVSSCLSGAFSLSASKSSDATYNFSITQIDAAGNTSSPAALQWTRNTSIPASPTIVAPASGPHYTNTGALVLSGACTTGYMVALSGVTSGDVTNPVGSLTQTCASSSYSFSLSKAVDGSYTLGVIQTNLSNNNESAAVSRVWILDTIPPANPGLIGPLPNPYTSGDGSIVITGNCAANATVNITGASVQSAVCASGVYAFTVAKGVDGTYNFTLTQTDLAGNVSGATIYSWIRDTSIPATPIISTPAGTTTYSNGNALTLSGSCITGYLMTLSGNVVASEVTTPASSLTFTCASSAFSFIIGKTIDGTYTFSVVQENTTTSAISGAASRTWTRDTSVPSSPAVSAPATSPYTGPGNLTITANCEQYSTVNLSGNATNSQTCTTGAYSFTVVQSVDATYNFTLNQTDRAGNISTNSSIQWVRDSASLSAPTIAVPAVSPFNSNTNTLALSGTCTPGLTVVLGGNILAGEVAAPAGMLTRECTVSGTYGFTIQKATDGTYSLSAHQTDTVLTSAAAIQVWVLDRVAPTLSVTSQPVNNNPRTTARFAFSTNDLSATLQCKLNGGTYGDCSSPVDLTGLANGVNHTYSIRSVDPSGNTSTVYSFTWQQSAYDAVSLYKFDTSPGVVNDSSLFAPDALTDSNTTLATVQKWGQARRFDSSTDSMVATSSSKMDLLDSRMTVEGWLNMATLPGNGDYLPLIQRSGVSSNYSWYIRLKRQGGGSNHRIAVGLSFNGTTWVEKETGNFSGAIDTWYHLAVSMDNGAVKVFVNGNSLSIASFGTGSIFTGAGDLTIGGSNGGLFFNGRLDEIRLSQTIRYTGSFTPPVAEFTAD